MTEPEAAQELMMILGPMAADAAIVGTTFGWPQVIAMAAAARQRYDQRDAEATRLKAAVLNQCGDNECWIEGADAVKALPESEFLESCRRYRLQLVSEHGEAVGLRTIAQLEMHREVLWSALKVLRIDANRLCDRMLGGTYEEDCRRAIDQADMAMEIVRGQLEPEQGWARIRIDMIGGTDVKSASRIYGEVEKCVVLLKVKELPPLDVYITDVGCVGEEPDVWGFACHPVDNAGERIVGTPDMFIAFEDVESIGVY